jgi:hypothetical protein
MTTLTNLFANVSEPEAIIARQRSSREQPHWEAAQIEARSLRMARRRGALQSMIRDSP